MKNQPYIIYRFAGITRFWMYLGSLLFLFGGSIAVFQEFLIGLILFAFASFSIWMAIETSTKIIITPKNIKREKHLFTDRKINFQSIVSIYHNRLMSRLEIRTNQNEKLYLPNQLENFHFLIETIRKKRPDLFSADGLNHFHRSKFITYLMIVFGLMMLGFGLFLPSNGDDLWARFIILGFALLCPFALLFEVQELIIKNDHFTLKYPFRLKHISKKDISEITLEQEVGRYGARTILIYILLINNKKIKLGGFLEGDLKVNASLQKWNSEN
ncbi:MAG: hypothetical protein ED557_10675 [Balneola sp.]|nr:MAG: hypothetical protein ED557_10675 [Balneola sp.]